MVTSPSRSLRSALEEVALNTENLQGLAPELASTRHEVSTEIRRYLTPRLVDAVDSLTVAVVGPSGVGKSALVNDLVGNRVTEEGALRPTTTTPIQLTGVAKDASAGLGSSGSFSRPRLVDAPVLSRMILIDMPSSSPFGRIRPADVALVVVSPERYADVQTWSLVNTLEELGVGVWLVMNRSEGKEDEAVADLRALAEDAGKDLPVYAVTDRRLVGQQQTDGGLTELKTALIDASSDPADVVWQAVQRRSARVAVVAKAFVGDVGDFAEERIRLADAVTTGFAPIGKAGVALVESDELAASADHDWKETADDLTERFSGMAETTVAEIALRWRETPYGASLLETHEGRDLSYFPQSSKIHMRQQLVGWRDDVSRNVRAKLRRNPRQSSIDELVEVVRIEALGGNQKIGFLARRRVSVPIEELVKDARRRLKQTMSSIGDHDAARFMKQLGVGPSSEEIGALAIAVDQLENVMAGRHG